MVNKDPSSNKETRSRSFPLPMDDKWADGVWSSLKTDIEEILHTNCYSSLEFEKLYRNAYTMVLHKFGEKLYKGLHKVISDHLDSKVRPEILSSSPENFLTTVIKVWEEHKTFILLISDIFMYVDRVYVQQNNVDCIYNLGLKVFREELIRFEEVRLRLSRTLTQFITPDRRGEDSERESVEACCKMLLDLGAGNRLLYEEVLEAPLLAQTAEFYLILSQKLLSENSSTCSYVKRIQALVEEQSIRANGDINLPTSSGLSSSFLDCVTESRILAVLDEEMISKHVTTIIEMEHFGLVDCLRQNKMEDLHSMYKLLIRVSNGVTAMADCLSGYLRQEGQTLITSPESRVNALHFVQSLLDLKDRYDELLVESFDNDATLKAKMYSDFEFLLSLNAEAAQHVSLFIDDKMRSCLAGLVDQIPSTDPGLEKAFVLFHCLEDKDEFERCFKLNLANRLLTDSQNLLENVWLLLNESIQQAKPDAELETTGEPYLSIKQFIQSHLQNQVRSAVVTASDDFISSLNEAWTCHKTLMILIRDILMYLNQVYSQQVNVSFVFRLGMAIFSEEIILFGQNRDRLRVITGKRLLESVEYERNGGTINRLSVKADCQMLMAFGCGSRVVYEEVFETPFLLQATQFYQAESRRLLAETSAPVYVSVVEALIYEEAQRAKQCLDESTEQWIVPVVEEEMIRSHLEAIVGKKDSGVVHMLKHQQTTDFNCMFKLLNRVSGGEKAMVSCLSAHLREEGKAFINSADELGPLIVVQNLLGLKDRHDSFISNSLSFDSGSAFRKALSADFEFILNLSPKSSEYLSLFIDEQLRQETNQLLDKSLILFRFLQSKDVFEHYYKQHLAKRLLNKCTTNEEAEKNFLSKLKMECGSHFTSKLEGMMKDMTISAATMEEFSSLPKTVDLDLHVRVLTAGFWPLVSPTASITLPVEARNAFGDFHTFYMAKHSGRLLTLQPALGTAELSAIFYGSGSEQRRYLLQVSTHQMCILMLFNSRNKLTYEEISQETNIPVKEFNRALQSLTKPTQQILAVDQQCTEFNFNTVFLVNEDFYSNLQRVKIQAVKNDQDTAESREVPVRVDEDRKYEIEAAIVRIMKHNRTMQHDLLMAEVTDELKNRFIPSSDSIKKRIEGLIERDYLVRAPNERNQYLYVA